MYLAENRPPKIKQTKAMAVGSAFDAYVKSEIAGRLSIPGYSREDLIVSQVEDPAMHDWAHSVGGYLLDLYIRFGGLTDLLTVIGSNGGSVRMEFSTDCIVDGCVPLYGKPDLYFDRPGMTPVIIDWKVNGFMSKASPCGGWIKCRDCWDSGLAKPTRQRATTGHPGVVDGVMVNLNGFRGTGYYAKWQDQLATYGLCAGVQSDLTCGIDQFVGTGKYAGASHLMRLAQHAWIIPNTYFESLIKRASVMWAIVTSKDPALLFPCEPDPLAFVQSLDDYYKAFEDDEDGAFAEMCR